MNVWSLAVGFIGGFVFGRLLPDLLSQRRLLDHRLRLEKEYQIYTELWDSLFQFTRACGTLITDLSDSSASEADLKEECRRALNEYQEVVLKFEPFIHQDIYEPARQILTLGRRIYSSFPHMAKLATIRARAKDSEVDEKVADRLVEQEQSNHCRFEEMQELATNVREAIRGRIMVRGWKWRFWRK